MVAGAAGQRSDLTQGRARDARAARRSALGSPTPSGILRSAKRFVDTISSDGPASLPARIAVRWRHIHEFEDVGDNQTRVIDRVETPVPGKALRSMFAYRHQQLADDLRAHREAAQHGLEPAAIAITGSSGLVGSALAALLSTGGHRVIRLVRGARRTASGSGIPTTPTRNS